MSIHDNLYCHPLLKQPHFNVLFPWLDSVAFVAARFYGFALILTLFSGFREDWIVQKLDENLPAFLYLSPYWLTVIKCGRWIPSPPFWCWYGGGQSVFTQSPCQVGQPSRFQIISPKIACGSLYGAGAALAHTWRQAITRKAPFPFKNLGFQFSCRQKQMGGYARGAAADSLA